MQKFFQWSWLEFQTSDKLISILVWNNKQYKKSLGNKQNKKIFWSRVTSQSWSWSGATMRKSFAQQAVAVHKQNKKIFCLAGSGILGYFVSFTHFWKSGSPTLVASSDCTKVAGKSKYFSSTQLVVSSYHFSSDRFKIANFKFQIYHAL